MRYVMTPEDVFLYQFTCNKSAGHSDKTLNKCHLFALYTPREYRTPLHLLKEEPPATFHQDSILNILNKLQR
jgi:hypothetical protein